MKDDIGDRSSTIVGSSESWRFVDHIFSVGKLVNFEVENFSTAALAAAMILNRER